MTDDAPRYDVVWTRSAETDLEELTWWWIEESPLDALALLKRIRNRVARLDKSPGRGRRVPELQGLGNHSIRELIVKPYRVVYEGQAGRVVVLMVFDGRRDLQAFLVDRLTRQGSGDDRT